MQYLRKNTAVIVSVGPFLDKGDGVTLETALTITNEKITLIAETDDGSAPTLILDNVTGATSGTDNDLNYITNNDAGMMQLELTAANTNRVGRLRLTITDAANHCPVFHEYTILPAEVYDSLMLGTDKLAVDAQEISSDSDAADNLEAAYDGTGYAGGTIKPKVDLDTIKTQTITCPASVTIGAFVGNATSAILVNASGHITANTAQWGGGTLPTSFLASNMITAEAVRTEMDANSLKLANLNATISSRAAPGDAMALTSDERTAVANEVEAQIVDDTDSERVLQAIVDKIAAANPSLDDLTLGGIASAVRTELTTELARIDAAISSRYAGTPPSAAAIRSEIDANSTKLDVAVSSRGTSTLTAGQVRTELSPELARIDVTVSTRQATVTDLAISVAAILADTNELQTDLTNGGRLDTILDQTLAAAQAAAPSTGGVFAQTVTVRDSNGTAIPNAIVYIFSGNISVDCQTANGSGVAVPTCDAGDYTLVVTADGYTSSRTEITVTAAASRPVTLTQLSITPSVAGRTTGYWTCYDKAGSVASGVICSLRLVHGGRARGLSLDDSDRTGTSNGAGVVQFVNLIPGAMYEAQRGTGAVVRIQIPTDAGSTCALDELLGHA